MVPERVTMEIMVRAFTIGAMEDASHKVNRSMKAAAMRWGARWRFTTVSAICL